MNKPICTECGWMICGHEMVAYKSLARMTQPQLQSYSSIAMESLHQSRSKFFVLLGILGMFASKVIGRKVKL